jgi:hypothetical protein
MGGGLMQLVAYGAQDIYLTGNPQITFFKVVYRRHTNFSMETIEQTINGNVAVSGSSTVTISRNGDLVYKIYVTNAGSTTTTHGAHIISEVELEIGGQRIDKHTAEWNQIWNELSTTESKAHGLACMIGSWGTSGSSGVTMTQYPLNFWFCRNPGLALPLIALQYHEVKLKFTWGSTTNAGIDTNVKVMCDYIYLDTDERRRFAQVSHEYLIEQIQVQSSSGTASNKLNFNHPVKELIWTSHAMDLTGYTTAKLVLNGHDRFSAQNSEYFQLRQPFDYHTAIPGQNMPSGDEVPKAMNAASAQPTELIISGKVGSSTDKGATFTGGITGVTQLTSGEAEIEASLALASGALAVSATAADEITDGLMDGAPARAIAATAARRPGAAGAAGNPVYSFLTADIPVLPAIGSVVQIHYSTDSGGSTRYVTFAVEAVAVGGGGSGNYSDACVHIIFNGRLEAFNNQVDQSALIIYSMLNGVGQAKQDHCRTSYMHDSINVYSFALKPEEHQPSGTCNFSRIDNAKLDFTGGTAPLASHNIYAINYNVLRIMSGMGGLAYSN